MQCARDVASNMLKNHEALEQHCEEVYKDLTTNVCLGISVPLDSNMIHPAPT